MRLKLRQRIWRWRGVLLTAPSVAGLVIGLGLTGLFQQMEWGALDQLFRLRPREPADPRIAIVTIDESDIKYVGRWPMPDAVLAELLKKLKAQQPRAIGLDIYRDLPVEPGHQELVKVFKSTPNLIGVEKAVGDPVAPPPTLSQLGQVAIADLVLDADGKVRRGLLSVKLQDGKTRSSLGAKLALQYLKAQGISLQMIDARKKHFGLGKAVFVPIAENNGGYASADAGGYQILLNFRGTQENFQTVSLKSVLENRIQRNMLRDRIILIGVIGQSLNDLFFTPYNSSPINTPKRMPGVVVHANLTSQIVSAALDGRPLIRTWNQPVNWLWILAWSFAGATVHWVLIRANLLKKNLLSGWVALGICILPAGGILFAGGYLAFILGWWIPVVPPLLAFTGSAIAIALYHSRELRHQAEKAVRESERKLAQFLEAVPVGVAAIDASGQPYYFNQRAIQLNGIRESLSGIFEPLSSVYQVYIAGTNQLYPSEQLPIMRALQGESSTADDIELHQGDKIIPLEIWGTPIYDESGNITYAIVAFADITERKKAEQALIQAEQKYRSIFENALEGIFQSTPDGRYLSANPALAHIYGYDSPQELIANLTDIQHQLYVDPQRRTEFVTLIQQHGEVSNFESMVYRKDGSIIWISENARAVCDAKRVLYYQGFVVEISERKQAEAERIKFTNQLFQLNQAFSRFVPLQFLQLLDKKSLVDVQLGDQVHREMSILFADIRDFTSLSESMTPQDNFQFINAYLSRMEPAIVENQGFIDKYIGDAIMALFSGGADDAVKAGIAMQKSLAEYNLLRTQQGYIPIQIGIGINTGSLMLGTVGGYNRMDGTVIGDAVNLASRIEALTKHYGVSLLISHHTFLNLQHAYEYAFRLIARVKVKGKSQMVSVFEVFDADPPQIREGKLATKATFEKAVWLYSRHLFPEAAHLFQDCLSVNPQDKAAQIYLERCQQQQRDSLTP